ncbi:MAG: HIRAN domain-containing protein [Egibacteraceae bacterium]
MIVWQDPASRSFHQVARLETTDEGEFRFSYLPDARLAPNFLPFAAFPRLHHEYRSDELFPFFANRVMSPRRPDFRAYLLVLGLTPEDWTPLELLARSSGERATDTVLVVAEPTADDNGHESVVFPVSGVRHLEGAAGRIARLTPGRRLFIRPETDNLLDPRAMLLDVATDEPVGWIPAYLLDYLHKHLDGGAGVHAFVERANGPDTPWHLRLLCRLEARPVGGA